MSIGRVAEFFLAKKDTKTNFQTPIISQNVGTPDERRKHMNEFARLTQKKAA